MSGLGSGSGRDIAGRPKQTRGVLGVVRAEAGSARHTLQPQAVTAEMITEELNLPTPEGLLARHEARLEALVDAAEGAHASDADYRRRLLDERSAAGLARRLAEKRYAALWSNPAPALARIDLLMQLRGAQEADPAARGLLGRAASHAQIMWESEPDGWLTYADLARFTSRHANAQSVVEAAVQDIGFRGLPMQKLHVLAAGIEQVPFEQREAAYVACVEANGLDHDTYADTRARAALRFLAELPNAADPILDAEEGPQPEADNDAEGALEFSVERANDPENEIPHEESTEVIDEIASPNTGEPMTLELGAADTEGGEAAEDSADLGSGSLAAPHSPSEFADTMDNSSVGGGDGSVGGLVRMGQLADFVEEPEVEGVEAEEDSAQLDADEFEDRVMEDASPDLDLGDAVGSVVMTDPTSPDQQVRVTVEPVDDEAEMLVDGPDADMDMGASRLAWFQVFEVNEGDQAPLSVQSFEARTLRHAVARVATALGVEAADAEVFSVAGAQASALVLTAPETGTGYRILAAPQTFEQAMNVSYPADGQPELQQGVRLRDGFHPDKVTVFSPKEPKTKKPTDASNTPKGFSTAAAARVVEKVVAGFCVVAGALEIGIDTTGTLVLADANARWASGIEDLDEFAAEFVKQAMPEAAAAVEPAAPATAPVPAQRLRVRAAFETVCRKCAAHTDWEEPDEAVDLSCSKCGAVTPARAIAVAMEKLGSSWMKGVVLTATIPGQAADSDLNAKRLIRAVREIVGAANVGAVWRDNGDVKLRLTGWTDAAQKRIATVLSDSFGVKFAFEEEQEQEPEAADDKTANLPKTASAGVSQSAAPVLRNYSVAVKTVGDRLRRVAVSAVNAGDARRQAEQYGRVIRAQLLPDMPMAPPAPVGADEGLSSAPDFSEPGLEPGLESEGLEPIGDVAPTTEPTEGGSVEQGIEAAFLHFRNTGVGILAALKQFGSSYGALLEQYGDETSPSRHKIEGEVVSTAMDVYRKPALIQPGKMAAAAASTTSGQPGMLNVKPKRTVIYKPSKAELEIPALKDTVGGAMAPKPKRVRPVNGGDFSMGPDQSAEDVDLGPSGAEGAPAVRPPKVDRTFKDRPAPLSAMDVHPRKR